jgi:hypothetical protein
MNSALRLQVWNSLAAPQPDIGFKQIASKHHFVEHLFTDILRLSLLTDSGSQWFNYKDRLLPSTTIILSPMPPSTVGRHHSLEDSSAHGLDPLTLYSRSLQAYTLNIWMESLRRRYQRMVPPAHKDAVPPDLKNRGSSGSIGGSSSSGGSASSVASRVAL